MMRAIALAGLLPILSLCATGQTLAGGVLLNEYNAVRADRWLDVDGASASSAADSFFGRVAGNGGRWFELVVVGQTAAVGETIDMRGWTFDWTSTDVGSGSFALTSDSRLGSIHRGTLMTFFSQDAGGPNVATNIDQYDPLADSWWLNVNLSDTDFIASGSLNTGNGDWQLTVRDASNQVVYGPAGEGVGNFSGVSSREVGKLEGLTAEDPNNTIAGWQAITPESALYNDGTSSSFGSANLWSGGSGVQELSVLRAAVPEPTSMTLLAIAGMAAAGYRLRASRRRSA